MDGEKWERLQGESMADFKKFCAYRDMGAGTADVEQKRSLRKLAKKINCRRQVLERLSQKYNWVDRAEAYDEHLEAIQRQTHEKEIEKMKEDHAAIAQQLLKKSLRRLLTLPEDEIKASDLVRMIDVGAKLERLSRGESTENQRLSGETRVIHSGKIETPQRVDLSQLNDEELNDLESLLAKLS